MNPNAKITDEQFEAYKTVLEGMNGKKVVVRRPIRGNAEGNRGNQYVPRGVL